MTIRQLEIKQSNKYPFCLDKVLNGTQDFRWRSRDNGGHCGVLAGHHIHVRQSGNVLEYYSDQDQDLNSFLYSYFRLDDDLDDIYAYLSSRDQKIADLIAKYPSTRIMRQPDPWECMAAFICSTRNPPPGIFGMVERIVEKIGNRVCLNREVRYAFPTPERVLEEEGKLEKLELGLKRVPNIVAASKRIRDGELDLGKLAQPDVCYNEAKRQLMACKGVGPKIADCIALFSLDKMNAFPVDSRVRTAVKAYYSVPGLEKKSLESIDRAIAKWAQDLFGPYAGYANQFLYTSS